MPSLDNLPAKRPSATIGVVLFTLSVFWCVYWFVHAWGYWEDDAWIHLEFARSVAAGQGFAFNGHVVAGDTAPLWVLLLVCFHALIPDWMVAGKVLTAAGAIFGLWGIYAFARSLAARLVPADHVLPAAIVLLTVANPYTCYWIFSGMEPIAAAGLACFAVLAATRDLPSAGSLLTACLLAGLAPLLRPEMVFLTALLALPILAQGRRLAASRTAVLIAGVILLVLPLALWSAYSLHAFGHILPNTNAAKRAGPHDSVIHRLLSIYSEGLPIIVCGLLAGVVAVALGPGSVVRSFRNALRSSFCRAGGPVIAVTRVELPLSGWIFILWPAIATVFYVVNHTYVQTRYILVTAPGLTIVILALLLQRSRAAGRLLYAAALVAALVVSIVIVRPFLTNKALNCEAVRNLALYIHDQIPPDAAVATYSIGEVAFVSRHPIVDVGGITRPAAIPYLNSPIEEMARWTQTVGARYYISGPPPEPGATVVYTGRFPYIGWTFHTALYSTSVAVALWKLPAPLPPTR